ncbi:MAG: hypothetical protein IK015_06460 [Treponema sp.]|nr:hypothetical protein [Treponema sp.]
MRRITKLAAILSAFGLTLALAACSNSSDSSGNGGGTSTTGTVYKGTYTVAGKSFTEISFDQSNKTYTMKGSSVSDNGTYKTNTSASVAKATGLSTGNYLMTSKTIKSANGDAAVWKVAIDSSGKVELDSLTPSDTGYVLANGTGKIDSSSSETSGGGSGNGSEYSAADVIKAFGIDPTNATKTLKGKGNETHTYGVDTDYTATWTMYIFGEEYETYGSGYSQNPGYAVVISERDYTAGTKKGQHEVYGFKGPFREPYGSYNYYGMVHPSNLGSGVPAKLKAIPLQDVIFGKGKSGKVGETSISKKVYVSGNSITDVRPGN